MSTVPRPILRTGVLIAALLLPATTPAATLTMQSTKTDAGARLCVGLESGGAKIAGTQNDLVWNGECAALVANSCAAVPDVNKPLHGNAPATMPNTYRALVFALDNVEPIRDGDLYCCDFELKGAAECCAVKLDRLGVSDPVGTALDVNGRPPQLCLNTGMAAPAAAAPPSAPSARPEDGGTPWLWIGLIAAAVLVAALLVARRRS